MKYRKGEKQKYWRTHYHETIQSMAGREAIDILDVLGLDEAEIKYLYKYMSKNNIPRGHKGFRKGERNANWNGGRHINIDGYVYVQCPVEFQTMANYNGYVREHRLVMAQKIGRPLTSDEVVHHRDGDIGNNHIDNLELFSSNGEHLAETLKGQCPNWSGEGLAVLQEVADSRRGKHPTQIAGLRTAYLNRVSDAGLNQ